MRPGRRLLGWSSRVTALLAVRQLALGDGGERSGLSAEQEAKDVGAGRVPGSIVLGEHGQHLRDRRPQTGWQQERGGWKLFHAKVSSGRLCHSFGHSVELSRSGPASS
jgi:hypothetical protein